MKEKKLYSAPKISSEDIKIGVFGCYGGRDHKPGKGWGGGWFGGWWGLFFGKKRRR